MTKRFFSLVLPFVLAVPPGAAQEANELTGRWRSVETSRGGIGAMYDLLNDGTVRFSPGAIVEEAYRLDGDRLTIGIGARDTMTYTVALNGDNHFRMSAIGSTEEYTRLGPRPDDRNWLLGEWIGSRDIGGVKTVIHWVFRDDSKVLLMIRFRTETGNFTLQSRRLVMTFGGRVGMDGEITIANGVLSIQRSGGRVTRLIRY